MLRVRIDARGQAFRVWDNQPLKTKIVATIGSPDSYKNGIYKLGLEKETSQLTYDYLIENFIRNGVNVIRLNMAFMNKDTTRSFFETLRGCINKIGVGKSPKIAVLTDLPGPRIRFENVPEAGINVQKGKRFIIYLGEKIEGNTDGASVCINGIPLTQYNKGAFEDIMDQIGRKIKSEEVRVITGDGEVMMKVIPDKLEANRPRAILECEAIKAGKIGNDRFTVKDIDFTIPSFTEEDKEKLNMLFESGAFQDDGVWAFIGLSFTQSGDDALRAREFLEVRVREQLKPEDKDHTSWYTPAIIAKIETSKGYVHKEEISDVVDGIMVARGDLGVQKDIEEIPTMEKELINLCNKRGKPVITATQMLRSMVESLEPTRAEVTDVFNSILDGTDAVMLSEETSKGCYPFHAIGKMISIAAEAEHFYEKVEMEPLEKRRLAIERYEGFLADADQRIKQIRTRIKGEIISLKEKEHRTSEEGRLKTLQWREALYSKELGKSLKQWATDSTSESACINSENEGIKAVIAITTTGRTAKMISRFRPTVKIIGATHDFCNACKLILSYGVTPINIGDVHPSAGPGEMFKQAALTVRTEGLLQDQDGVVLTSGNRPREPGTTNTIQIQEELRFAL